jgi:hypothetical protein
MDESDYDCRISKNEIFENFERLSHTLHTSQSRVNFLAFWIARDGVEQGGGTGMIL